MRKRSEVISDLSPILDAGVVQLNIRDLVEVGRRLERLRKLYEEMLAEEQRDDEDEPSNA